MLRVLLLAACLATTVHAQSYSVHGDEQLAAYIQKAIDENPGVGRYFAQYRASLQKIPQVTALPDPVLGIAPFLRSPETRVGPQTFGVSLSQKLPWFGKLDERGKVALREAEVKAKQYEAAKAEVVRQVKLSYYELAYVDAGIAVTREEIDLLSHFERVARDRYALGNGLQQSVVKLQAEVTRRQNRLEQLRAQRVDAEVTLNALMNRPARTTLPRTILAARPKLALSLEPLYELAQMASPEMQASFLEIERDEKKIHAAKKEYWPDVTFGVGYVNVLGRRDQPGQISPPSQNGKDVWSLSFGVNLPINRRKRDAAVLEATESMLASKKGYEHQRNSIEAAIRSLSFRVETLTEQISLFEDTLLPQSEQALRSSEAAYATGAISVLELLDSERTLLEVRLGLARLRTDYMKTVADLERTVGAPLPEETS